jgi:DNA-binding transcriptional MocR family regulator
MAKIDATTLAGKLMGWDSGEDSLSKPARLAGALRELVDGGSLVAGTQLPAERALGQAVGVSRATVTEAFRRLREDGWLDSRQGSGSRVRGTRAGGVATDGRLVSISGHETGELDLSSGALPGLSAVGEAFGALQGSDLEPFLGSDGYWPYGIPPLREAVADYYCALGVPTTCDDILITAGSQQAVSLLAHSRLAAGDRVAVEDPTYRGAISVFAERNARLMPLPMTSSGPDLRVLETATRTTPARMVYLIPTAHNPRGATMSEHARQRLAGIAAERALFVVDDGSTAETLLDRTTMPTLLAQHLPAGQTATIGTASKLWWGGLRVGWIRTSPELVRHLAEVRRPFDLGGPVAEQLVTARLLADVDAHRVERRSWLQQRYTDTVAALREFAPQWEFGRPTGGTTLWIRLPGVDVVALCSLAYREHGLKITSGAACSPTDSFHDVLRIPYAKPVESIRKGLSVLAELARDPRVVVPRREIAAPRWRGRSRD